MGSWKWDEHLLRELDTVLEARSELDILEQLEGCPLLGRHGQEFHAFFSLMPELLSTETSVATFQLRLQQLLVLKTTTLDLMHSS